MIEKVLIFILLIRPTVVFADQALQPTAIYARDMKPMTLLVASATEVSACGLRSRRWNALIQGASVIEAYSLAGRIWGTRNNNLTPEALAHFEGMGNSLERIRSSMANPTADDCKVIGRNPELLPALDGLAQMAGWGPN